MSRWPQQSGVPAFFGEAGSARATAGMVELAYPMKVAWEPSQIIRRFRCHEFVAPAFTAIFRETLAAYGEQRIKALGLDMFGGCYNFRPMRHRTSGCGRMKGRWVFRRCLNRNLFLSLNL